MTTMQTTVLGLKKEKNTFPQSSKLPHFTKISTGHLLALKGYVTSHSMQCSKQHTGKTVRGGWQKFMAIQ